ncbi:MAG: MFS transporter [Micrococcales bacterium]|nr:MFS transporter [Micrococcales bacterium]
MGVAADVRALRDAPGFWRLVAVRLLGQGADGALQSGLATLFFFSPERASTPAGVAAAFAVMLGPFTLVGPWAGVLLDRFPRRGVLVWSNLARMVLAGAIAAIMALAGVTPAIYVLALIALALNRFVLATIPAAQPRVVAPDVLITANSLAPTLGSVAAGGGALIGFVVTGLLGSERRWVVVAIASVCFAASAWVAGRFSRSTLGPDAVSTSLGKALSTLMSGLAAGARQVWRARAATVALAAMAVSRVTYALVLMASILMSRNLFTTAGSGTPPDDGATGLGPFGLIVGFGAAGFALAAVVTPVVRSRVAPETWAVWCLATAAIAQGVIASTTSLTILLPMAALLSAGVQGVKIAADTIVQREVPDSHRGRAFALYDMLYNAGFLLAAVLGALLLPEIGHSPVILGALAVGYLIIAFACGRAFASVRSARQS